MGEGVLWDTKLPHFLLHCMVPGGVTQPEAMHEFSHCNPSLYRWEALRVAERVGSKVSVSTQSAHTMSKLQDPVRSGE